MHKLADGRGAAAVAVCQAMCCDIGIPSLTIQLITEQAALASVFWAGRLRALPPHCWLRRPRFAEAAKTYLV